MHDTLETAKVERSNIDQLLRSYWSWLANWDELRDWEQAYLKALAWQKERNDGRDPSRR